MKALEIKKGIYWVGAVDYSSHDFHGYSLSPRGTSYNAYLVRDEKTVLIDTVKKNFTEVMLDRLSGLTDLQAIDYIVVNHVEADHAGALPELIAACGPEAVFCSPMGLKAIEAHFADWKDWPLRVVKSGDSIRIGQRGISFVETRMLHWPDSMASYLPEDKILFSNDAFGQNIACSERFADEIEPAFLEQAMLEYYHNIVLPYSQQVVKVLDLLEELKLDIDMIAPDHGLIFRGRRDVRHVLDTYRRFAAQKTRKRAVIVYDTMWRSTEKMACSIAEGLVAAGVPTRIMDLKTHHHSAVMTEVASCGLVVVGSPTHNNGILPFVAGFLTYMRGLRPQNRLGAAFGSFGWSGECVRIITDSLNGMGLETPVEALKNRYVPGPDALRACVDMGTALAAALADKCGS